MVVVIVWNDNPDKVKMLIPRGKLKVRQWVWDPGARPGPSSDRTPAGPPRQTPCGLAGSACAASWAGSLCHTFLTRDLFAVLLRVFFSFVMHPLH